MRKTCLNTIYHLAIKNKKILFIGSDLGPGVLNDFKKKTDNKHEIDVRIDIMNSTLHMKRLKKPHLKLATKDGKKIDKKDEILVKHIDDKD